ncbi:MAG: PilX N-terminal domain-containing pilus assembly protein [Gammaproteobacteria bacterium]
MTPARRPATLRAPLRAGQRGAAALVVVLLLLLVVALVAGYTGRNLIFEQRTSANQYRSTQALEAAEAGIEWALTMLNAGRVDAQCQPHVDASTTDTAFRQRYLQIAADTGMVTALKYDKDADGTAEEPLRPACVFDGSDWRCSCPAAAAPALAEPAGAGPFPAFRVRFHDAPDNPAEPPYPAGVVRVEATGCTRLDTTPGQVCADATSPGDAQARVTVLAALKGALAAPPAAALSVRGELDVGASLLRAINSVHGTTGITVLTGDAALQGTPLLLASAPGTPTEASVVENDPRLSDPSLTPDRMFTGVFGAGRDTYRQQPAAVELTCSPTCSGAAVRDLVRLDPGRVVWIGGNLDLDTPEPIGTAAEPALLVVNGELTASQAGAVVNGVVYLTGAQWGGVAATVRGAVVAESALTLAGTGPHTVEYDAATLSRLHKTHGSFVRVPGSWRDF